MRGRSSRGQATQARAAPSVPCASKRLACPRPGTGGECAASGLIMQSTTSHSCLSALGLLGLLGLTVLAQQPAPGKPPLTPDGHPDLQGVWVNNTITPFERPAELAGREFLTPAELQTLKERAARLFSGSGDTANNDELFLTLLHNPVEFRRPLGSTGDYNQFWLDDGLVFENRTSQVIDPPDGLLPPLTEEGARKLAAALQALREHPADGPESRFTQERCITFGTAKVGWLLSRNNSFHQIVQTRDHVVLYSELIHEARIVPLDGRPHIGAGMRLWDGDSRGRWMGETLVIDTMNFSAQTPLRPKLGLFMTAANVHLTERLSLVDMDTLRYEVTVDDPTTWTRPWSAVTTWKRSAEQMFEYACHEGNAALQHILSGARDQERRATP